MNLHEYQSKALLRAAGVPVPEGRVAHTADEARAVADDLGGGRLVVKAQAHTGGRGKAGGVVVVEGGGAVGECAARLIGSRLVTHQTGADGLPVTAVLVEQPTAAARELYLALLVDRACRRVAIMASPDGGMDIEAVAAATPERIFTSHVDPAAGFMPWQGRRLAFALGLDGRQAGAFTKIAAALYDLFVESDASLIEINPLAVTAEGGLIALDAKINLDDSGLYRHPELAALRDAAQEDGREAEAREHELNYIHLDGDIGCMVNGAGLAMATMDLIKLHGGSPANFLDVGGGTTAARVAEAFKLILSDGKVKAVFVNIFGGIVRCDLIAEGIIAAIGEIGVAVPVVVRLEGTNVEKGRALLVESGLDIIAAADLTDGAQKAVAAAEGGA